jgi:predicted transcriptional regulator
MAKKRERLEVIYDILKVIQDKNGKIKPTHIIYKSNLSHQMLNEYLGELIDGEFIIEHNTSQGKNYELTQKGFDYIDKYNVVIDFIDSFGLNG